MSWAKQKKTATELAELIAAEIPLGDALLAIERAPNGWNATVYGSSHDHLAKVQQPVAVVAQWYGLIYDLDVSS
jgi:hypothetical protein